MSMDMEACMKAATPGEHHKKLDAFVGTWDAKVSFIMDPSEPPQVSHGTMVNDWILGGRFLEQRYESSMNGMPFIGRGLCGYNNAAKRYEGMWTDTMSTQLQTESGTLDASGKVFTMTGECVDPSSGRPMTKRSVTTIKNKDEHTMEMFFPGPDGKECRAMEIVYTRKK